MKFPYKGAGMVGKGLLWWFKFGFAFIFLSILVIHIIGVAVESKDIGIVFREIGSEIINPLNNLQDISLKQDIGLADFVLFFYNFYIIYLWFRVIMIPVNLLMKDSNPPILRFAWGFILFSCIMIVYSVAYLKESPMYPLIVLKNSFVSAYKIISNISLDSIQETLKPVNSCNQSVCNI